MEASPPKEKEKERGKEREREREREEREMGVRWGDYSWVLWYNYVSNISLELSN